MRRFTALAAVLPLITAAGALAQGTAYNRGLRASDIAVAPAPSGDGYQITGDLHIDGDGSISGDVGTAVTVLVNGAVAGPPNIFGVQISGLAGRPNCTSFCWSCNGFCLNLVYVCICFTRQDDPGAPSNARFAIEVPHVAPGDVVSVRLDALPGSLPEIDATDDVASFVIGGPVCPSDFNADGAVNSQDFFDFLNAFFAFRPDADFNADGAVNSQDFFDFLTAFFAGC
jgi:hypothetical protein